MKSRRASNLVLLLLSALLLVLGCANPVDPSAESGAGVLTPTQRPVAVETGSLVITTGGIAPSTITPDLSTLREKVAGITVDLVHVDGNYQAIRETEYQEGQEIAAIPVGTWRVLLTGVGASGLPIAGAQEEVTVRGGVNELLLTIEPLQGATGSMSYGVDWSAGADTITVDRVEVSLRSYGWDVGTTERLTFSADGSESFQEVAPATVTVDLGERLLMLQGSEMPSGYYTLTVQLYKGTAEYAPVVEVIRIYDALESAGGVRYLDAEDLTTPPASPGSIGVSLTGVNSFSLEWSDTSKTETGYRVYPGAATAGPVVELPAGSVGAASVDLGYAGGAGEAVSYAVVAYNQFGDCDPVEITFTPMTIPALTAPRSNETVSSSTILAWEPAVGGESYRLYLSREQAPVAGLDPTVRYEAASGQPITAYGSVPDLATTSYFWTVEAVNREGNGTLSAPVRSFRVDTLPPAPPTQVGSPELRHGAITYTTVSTPTLNWSAAETGGSFEYRLDNGATLDTGNGSTPTLTLPAVSPGDHIFQVRQIDPYGNKSGWSEELAFRYVEAASTRISLLDPTLPGFSVEDGLGYPIFGRFILRKSVGNVATLAVVPDPGVVIEEYAWSINRQPAFAGHATVVIDPQDPTIQGALTMGVNTVALQLEIDGFWYSRSYSFLLIES